MQPCEQKEEIHAIKAKLDSRDEVLGMLRVKQAEIKGQVELVGANVEHIKGRIDNGMSLTIKETNDIIKSLKPVIEHHGTIVKRIEDIGWLISRWVATSLVVVLIALIVWAITKGFTVPRI